MSFTRVREIKGKLYLYEETRWREGGKVRSRSRSLGPLARLGGLFKVSEENVGLRQLERQGEEADRYREKLAAERAHFANLEKIGTELAKEKGAEAPSTQSSFQGTGQPDAPGSTEAAGGPPSDR